MSANRLLVWLCPCTPDGLPAFWGLACLCSHRSLYLPVLHPWAKLCQDGLDVLLILFDLEVLRGFIERKQMRVITSQGWRFSCTDQIRMANHDVDCNVVNWFLRYLYIRIWQFGSFQAFTKVKSNLHQNLILYRSDPLWSTIDPWPKYANYANW